MPSDKAAICSPTQITPSPITPLQNITDSKAVLVMPVRPKGSQTKGLYHLKLKTAVKEKISIRR